MSILSNLLRGIAALLFTPLCPVCGGRLCAGERHVCTRCRLLLPLTYTWTEEENPVLHKFDGLVPLMHASAFFYYGHADDWRRAVHAFKYGGMWRSAEILGRWYGDELHRSGLYRDADVVVPVPLHPLKRLRRGYNQSEYIARGIAAQLGLEVDVHSVVRCRNTSPQARRSKAERLTGVTDAFAVRRPERLAGRHILLVDDVLTTGSTLAECAKTLVEEVPDCCVSIAVLGVVAGELHPVHQTL